MGEGFIILRLVDSLSDDWEISHPMPQSGKAKLALLVVEKSTCHVAGNISISKLRIISNWTQNSGKCPVLVP